MARRAPAGSHFLSAGWLRHRDICHVWDLHCFIIDTPFRRFERLARHGRHPDLDTLRPAPWRDRMASPSATPSTSACTSRSS
jgi:hypothetical protein